MFRSNSDRSFWRLVFFRGEGNFRLCSIHHIPKILIVYHFWNSCRSTSDRDAQCFEPRVLFAPRGPGLGMQSAKSPFAIFCRYFYDTTSWLILNNPASPLDRKVRKSYYFDKWHYEYSFINIAYVILAQRNPRCAVSCDFDLYSMVFPWPLDKWTWPLCNFYRGSVCIATSCTASKHLRVWCLQ